MQWARWSDCRVKTADGYWIEFDGIELFELIKPDNLIAHPR